MITCRVNWLKAANHAMLQILKSVVRSESRGRTTDRFPRICIFLRFAMLATAAYEDTSGYDSRCQAAPTLAKAGL